MIGYTKRCTKRLQHMKSIKNSATKTLEGWMDGMDGSDGLDRPYDFQVQFTGQIATDSGN